ncbi:MAG TPA: sigma-54 dependent transcriptional regulator, partial [Smithellaceae bacterium]|nr:sigma-54 dependent transcriptional regulator [Smithellaceae bacterium]
MKILIVDDEQVALTSIQRLLKRRGLRNVEICDNGSEAITRLKNEEFDVVLLDILMPDTDGLKVLESVKPYCPQTEFIVLTAIHDIAMTVKTLRLGAYDYLVKPVDNELLLLAIERAYEHKGLLAGIAGTGLQKNEAQQEEAFAEIVTQCPRLRDIIRYLNVMAKSGNPILVTGESGTGKELIARGIHLASPNKEGPFVPVNVASIPETMFESHFFGHVRGAFTGADKDYAGYFEQAGGGTLFLDEIGELAPHLQVKFLRVIEEKLIVRLGDTRPRFVDVRIVSATNSDLDRACQEGRFRLDLFYRLRSATIHLPPLRER